MQRISNRIHIAETPDNFTLVISDGFFAILKYVFILISICVLIVMIVWFVFNISLTDVSLKPIKGILAIFIGIVYLKKALTKEVIEVTKNSLTIKQKKLFVSKIRTYLISDISHFTFAGKRELHVDDFDYLGVKTNWRQLQNDIQNGTLEFFYKGVIIRFGRDILSWEAEEIIYRIEKFTGNNLQMDDSMGKLLDDLKDKQIHDDDDL